MYACYGHTEYIFEPIHPIFVINKTFQCVQYLQGDIVGICQAKSLFCLPMMAAAGGNLWLPA